MGVIVIFFLFQWQKNTFHTWVVLVLSLVPGHPVLHVTLHHNHLYKSLITIKEICTKYLIEFPIKPRTKRDDTDQDFLSLIHTTSSRQVSDIRDNLSPRMARADCALILPVPGRDAGARCAGRAAWTGAPCEKVAQLCAGVRANQMAAPDNAQWQIYR